VIVSGESNRGAQKLLILVDAFDEGGQEQQKLRVLARRLAGGKEVFTGVGGKRPVVVLAGAVDARKGLFMQQADKTVPVGNLFHDVHRQLILIARGVAVAVHGRHFVLAGGNLIVLGLGVDAELPELFIQVLHVGGHARADGAVVVIVQLLPLRGFRAEERPAAHAKVLTLEIKLLVDQEIFLFGSDVCDDLPRLCVAEQTKNPHRLTADRVNRAQQRRFFVKRFSGVGEEDGRNIERTVLDEGVGGGVPGGVASCLERRAQSARRERRGIRLAAYQLLAGKLHDNRAVTGRGDEAVVLFGGEAGPGLEPVGKVRRALLQRPCLHAVGNVVGNGKRQRFAFLQTRAPGVHGSGLDVLLHRLLVKYTAAEQGRNPIGGLIHVCILLFCA